MQRHLGTLAVLFVLSPIFLHAQQVPSSLSLSNQAPSGITQGSASACSTCTGGGQAVYYYVIVRYPAGLAYPVNGIITARNTAGVGNLSASNYNVITWGGVSGATGYDVIRQSTPGSATSPCTGCAVVLNTSGNTVNDTGQNGGNYPPNLPSVQNVQGQFSIDNENQAVPLLKYGMTGTPVYNVGMVNGTPTPGQAAIFNADGSFSSGTGPASSSATNLAGGSPGQFPYQSAPGVTGFRTPNVANGPIVLDGSGNASLPGSLAIGATVLDPVKGLIAPGGTSGIIVLANGNVGIGTTSPSFPLTIQAPSPVIQLTAPSTGVAGFNLTNSAGTLNFGMDSTRTFTINDQTAGTGRVYMTSAGFFGLGNYSQPTNLPKNNLSVAGSASVGFGIGGDVAAPSNGMIINGNVGIGTTSPSYGLDVSRGVGLTGTARFFDQTATTGSTLVTITPGAAQTSASVTSANGGSQTVTGTVQAGGYKSSDGSAGVTVTACTAFKNGLCVAGS